MSFSFFFLRLNKKKVALWVTAVPGTVFVRARAAFSTKQKLILVPRQILTNFVFVGFKNEVHHQKETFPFLFKIDWFTVLFVRPSEGPRPVPKGRSGVRKNPPTRAKRSAQPTKTFSVDFLDHLCERTLLQSFCFYFLLPDCIKSQGLAPFFQNFPGGACPRTYYQGLGFTQADFGPPEDNKNFPV